MMWHFAMGPKCERCEYWDTFYGNHLDSKKVEKGPFYNIFKASKPIPLQTISDEEMAEIEMPHGSDQSS